MQAALGGAFAAAVLPVSAQTVTTDSEGLDVDTVEIRSGDASVPAYRAQPKDKTNLPVVIVIHEIFGVHAHIADVCRRFAKLGYLAIAPDLFARQGNAEKYPTIKDLVEHIVSKVPDRQVTEDLDATVAWAGKNGGDLSRLGVVGFCWGGRQSWLYAEHNPHVRAAVAWYGFVEGKTDEMTPFNPVDHASLLKVPVLGLYGEGCEHHAGVARRHAQGNPDERFEARARIGDRRVPGCRSRVLCRLPAELCEGRRGGELEARDRVAPQVRRDVNGKRRHGPPLRCDCAAPALRRRAGCDRPRRVRAPLAPRPDTAMRRAGPQLPAPVRCGMR